ASNIAYGWWSHDIGGHTSGDGDNELFTRWVQFGVLSPIMRIHSTKGYFYDHRPWMKDDDEVAHALRETLQLRHALIPYLYTMAWRAHCESLPLMLPMYYAHPEAEAAYHCPQQYLFGTELIAAPFTDPADPDTRLARQVVWLPEGDWYHFFSGEHFEGDRWHAVYGSLRDIPLFARAGAIVPLGPKVGWGGVGNPNELHVHLFPGADSTFKLYEDDGATTAYAEGHACQTTLAQRWYGNRLEFRMDAAEGDTSLIPAERTIHLHVHNVRTGVTVGATVDGAPVAVATRYDEQTEMLVLDGIRQCAHSALKVTVQTDEATLCSQRPRQRETILRLLKAFKLHIGVRNKIADELDVILADPDKLAPYLITMAPSQTRALFETLYQAGVHHVADTHEPTLLVLWNNRRDETITYRYNDAYLYFGFVDSVHHQQGIVPRFMTFTPKLQTWSHGTRGEHVQRTQWHVQIDYHNLATVVEEYLEQTP
ncbi:MAG: DUF5110 domain-containing protein, partial [Anaerolineae bacterium]|nr:DUF5110 domain-containing protein [Anaerolineae bacterium]